MDIEKLAEEVWNLTSKGINGGALNGIAPLVGTVIHSSWFQHFTSGFNIGSPLSHPINVLDEAGNVIAIIQQFAHALAYHDVNGNKVSWLDTKGQVTFPTKDSK